MSIRLQQVELRRHSLPTIFSLADQRLLLRMPCATLFDNPRRLSQVRHAAGVCLRIRPSSDMKLDVGNEEFRAQIKTLQYELEMMKQERELSTVHHAKELRDLQTKAEVEYKKAQVVPSYVRLWTYHADGDMVDFREQCTYDLAQIWCASQGASRVTGQCYKPEE